MSDVLELQEAVLDGGIRAVNFFTGRLLSGKDFGREQEARRDGDARLGEALGSGIAQGLEVEESTTNSGPGKPVVKVYAGEAVNACGQTLCLAHDAEVALAQQPAAAPASGALFTACGALASGSYVSGAGVYILTLAPAEASEGKAATNGLDPFNVRCNTDATVEAVQFRLLAVPPAWYAALDKTSPRFRNQLAALFFGDGEVDGVLTKAQPPASSDYAESGAALSAYDVPLALVYFASNKLQFIDNGAVRRRVTRAALSSDWSLYADDRRAAESEAHFLAFQEQLAAVAKPLASAKTVAAATVFAELPPAGILPIGANQFDWKSFLGAAAPTVTTDLDRGLVRSVLRHSYAQEPVALGASTARPYHVYRVLDGSGVAAPYVLFARSALGEVIAADTSFDNSLCQLPGADNVQTAIEELWKLTRCGCTIVVAPGAGWEKVFDQIPANGDAELCFQAGDYPLAQPVHVAGRGWLTLSGAGPGTRIHADGAEVALSFESCNGVSLRDLAVSAGSHGTRGAFANIGGALSFANCGEVNAEHLALACASASSSAPAVRAASCLAVRNDAGRTKAELRVRACTFTVGAQQVGIQAVNVTRAQIEDNVLRVAPRAALSFRELGSEYRALLTRRLFADPKPVKRATDATQRPTPPAATGADGKPLEKPVIVAPDKVPDKVVVAPRLLGASAPAQPPVATAKAAAKTTTATRAASKAATKAATKKPATPKAAKKAAKKKRTQSARAAKPVAVAVQKDAAAPKASAAAGGAAAPAAMGNDIAHVSYNGIDLNFRTVPALARPAKGETANAWQQVLDQAKPSGVTDAASLASVLGRYAGTVLADGRASGIRGVAGEKFGAVVAGVLAREVPVAAQGIVIAGQGADEIRILDNTLDGFTQGIHVALSQHDAAAPTRSLSAGSVTIRGNTVRVLLASSTTRERHGIFVGNCASLAIEHNRLSAVQNDVAAPQRIEAIRVWGAVGRRMLIRANHSSGFTIGVRFWPTNLPRQATPSSTRLLWSIGDNLLEGASTAVQIAPRPNHVPIPSNVASFVRDLGSNLS